MSILLALLTSLSLIEVYSRTCVCIYFIPENCNAQVHCLWHNTSEATHGALKGSHGICRQQEWFACHVDPNCVHPGNDPDLEFAEQDLESQKTHRRMANEDWPFCCKKEEPNQPPRCPEDQVPTQIPQEDELYNILTGKSETHNNYLLSMNMIGKLIGLITFIVLISIGICYKFVKKDYKQLANLKSNYEKTYNSI